MAASLDDVVDALNGLRDLLEDIRDGGGGGGAGGAAGTGSAGRVASGGPGGGGSPLGALKGISGAIGAANSLSQATGISAGLNARALGATGDQALGVGITKAARTATELPFGDVLFANTANTLAPLDRAEKSTADLASQVALAGGDLSESGIRGILSRRNELEQNAQNARNTVRNIQGEFSKGKVGKVLGQEAQDAAVSGFAGAAGVGFATDELKAVVKEMTDAFREAIGNVRRVN